MAEFDDINESKGLGVPVHLYEFRGSDAADSLLENNVQSLILGPAHGAFALASSRVDYENGQSNTAVGGVFGDLVKSVEQMEQKFPQVRHITITPAWFGTNINASDCLIGPRVGADYSPPTKAEQAWSVAGQLHGDALVNTNPHWQGTPSDWAVRECIAYLKSKGFSVSVMPVLLMEVEGYPSSNLITGSLTDFMTQYTAFMTHYAGLAKAAEADGFIAGYGLDGLIADSLVGTPETFESCRVQGADTEPSIASVNIGISLTCMGDTPSTGTGLLDGVITLRSDTNLTWDGVLTNNIQITPLNVVATRAPNDGANDAMVQRWIVSGAVFDFTKFGGIVITTASGETNFTGSFEGNVRYNIVPARPPAYDTALPALLSALSVGSPLCRVSGADPEPDFLHFTNLTLECDGETPTEGTASLGGVIEFTANSAWNGKFRVWLSGENTSYLGTATQISGGNTGLQEWRIDGAEWDFAYVSRRELLLDNTAGSVFTPALPPNSFTFTFDGELTSTATPPILIGFALSPQNNLTPVGDLIADNTATAFIALTHTIPLSDWRRGKANLDRDNGFASQYNLDYLRHNLAGGEGYEWDYATPEDAATQTRTFDPAPTIENGRKYKDISGWYSANVSRQTKPIVFVEIAYPSISYGTNPIDPATNAPRDALAYTDPDTGTISFATDRGSQRAGCEAVLSFYADPANNPISPTTNAPMVDLTRSSVACWDARLYPYSLRPARDPATGAELDHPANPDLADTYEQGLILNGKVARPPLTASNLGKWYFTDYDEPITKNGNVYEPTQVKPPTITREGTLKTEPLALGIPFNHPIAELLKDLRSQVPLVLTALRGHIKDDGTPTAFYPLWTGRAVANTRTLDSVSLDILPFSSVLERVGLTRAYTISCPHPLYGGQCKANIARATNKDQVVQSISGADLVMVAPADSSNTADRWNAPHDPADFERGIVQFFDGTITHRRQIISVNGADEILLDTRMPALAEAMAAYTASLDTDEPLPQPVVDLILGCKHTLVDCEFLHNNLHNFGGAPKIPDKNPFSDQVRVFYRGS